MNDETFENHALYNKFLSIQGMRVNESGTKPSIYITEIKLKKAIKELPAMQIEELFDNEMSLIGIEFQRNKLMAKVESFEEWQLLHALNILLKDGKFYAVKYILESKRSDKKPD